MADPMPVEVADGLKEAFFKTHRKDKSRAQAAWDALVDFGRTLGTDPFAGVHIPKRLFPRRFGSYENLWKVDLPHAFRAVYTVLGRPGGQIRVAVEWIGDHKEYDRLFGYSTS